MGITRTATSKQGEGISMSMRIMATSSPVQNRAIYRIEAGSILYEYGYS
jgi:hypothetical protein